MFNWTTKSPCNSSGNQVGGPHQLDASDHPGRIRLIVRIVRRQWIGGVALKFNVPARRTRNGMEPPTAPVTMIFAPAGPAGGDLAKPVSVRKPLGSSVPHWIVATMKASPAAVVFSLPSSFSRARQMLMLRGSPSRNSGRESADQTTASPAWCEHHAHRAARFKISGRFGSPSPRSPRCGMSQPPRRCPTVG